MIILSNSYCEELFDSWRQTVAALSDLSTTLIVVGDCFGTVYALELEVCHSSIERQVGIDLPVSSGGNRPVEVFG